MVCINLKIEAIYLCNRKEKGTFILILPVVERDTASMLLLLVFFIHVVVFESVSYVQLFSTPWTAACQFPVLHYLPEFA